MTDLFRRGILILCATSASLFLCGIALAADVEPSKDPVVLLAMMKSAAGGSRLDALASRHVVWRITVGGLSGVAEQWDELKTGRTYGTYKLGLLSGAQGFDGKVLWTQDESGQSRAETARDATEASISSAYRTSMAQWFPDRRPGTVTYAREDSQGDARYYVLHVSPQGGRDYDLWVNRQTNLVEQLAERESTGMRIETYSDYRDVAGVRMPFAVLVSRGDAKYDQLFALDRVDFDAPLEQARFAQPGRPIPDYAFPAGKASVEIPIRLLNGHIYMLVKLNGKGPFLMLFDSGGANILQPDVAKSLGLAVEGTLSAAGVGERRQDVGITRIDRLDVGGIEVRDQVFSALDLQDFGTRVEGVDAFGGVVGYELMKRFPVKIDYDRSVVTFYEPEAFKYSGSGARVPFRFKEHTPQVDGSIDGIPGVFDIDTGSRSSVDLLGPFVEQNGLVAKYHAATRVVSGSGVGGRVYSLLARAGSLTLGTVSVTKPVAYLSQQKNGSFSDITVAGNVGFGVLRQFNVTFDYPHQQIYFDKNASYGRPDVPDRAGIWLERTAQGYEIIDVVDDGPADRAGLVAGDVIRAIDGKSIETWSLADARERLKAAVGTKILLLIAGNKPSRQVEIVLRDLI